MRELEQLAKEFKEIIEIGNRAVKKAQQENRILGIPNTYFVDGVTYYEWPNGELSLIDSYLNNLTHPTQLVQ